MNRDENIYSHSFGQNQNQYSSRNLQNKKNLQFHHTSDKQINNLDEKNYKQGITKRVIESEVANQKAARDTGFLMKSIYLILK